MPEPRKRLRLTLGVLMGLVLALGGGLGWLAHIVRVEREAVAAIVGAKGSVLYDWQYKAGTMIPNGKPRGPKWLRAVVPPELLDEVTSVDVLALIDDALMEHIGRLSQVESLTLAQVTPHGTFGNDSISPRGFAHLVHLKKLRRLTLWGVADIRGLLPSLKEARLLHSLDLMGPPPDDEMVYFAGLTSLDNLMFSGKNVTDASYAHLSSLKNLTSLIVGECRISDRGFSALSGLSALKTLVIERYRRTGTGPELTSLTPLASLANLESLDVAGYPIDDRGLLGLGALKKLKALRVEGAKITDVGLEPLLKSESLTLLDLGGAKITEDGMARVLAIKTLEDLILGPGEIRSLAPLALATARFKRLSLYGCPIDDAGLAALPPSSPLMTLNLNDARVTDAGLAPLARLKSLQSLSLRGAPLTDAAVDSLANLPALQEVHLSRTKITDEGFARLQKAKPSLRMTR